VKARHAAGTFSVIRRSHPSKEGENLTDPSTAGRSLDRAPATLARAGGDPWLVAREGTAELLEHRGLVLSSVLLGEFTVPVRAMPRLEAEPDALLVATKASGLREALARVPGTPALVVPLLNGLEHMELLRERFGAERVAAGVIRIESDSPRPAVVVQTSPTVRVDLASERPALQQPLQRLAETLEAAQVPVRVEAVEAQVLWSKLVRLNALALTTSASDRPLGEIRCDPEWRAALEGAVHETAAVARAEGATLDPAATTAVLEQAHAAPGSFMPVFYTHIRPHETPVHLICPRPRD